MTSVAAADVNGDGRIDLAATGADEPGVTLLLRRADGTYTPSLVTGVGHRAYRVEIADVDGDGRAGLAVNNADDNQVTALLQHEGSFSAATPLAIGRGAYEMASGDLDGDGRADLVTADQRSETISVVSATGSGLGVTRIPVAIAGSNPAAASIADLTGDHRADLVVSGVGGGHDAVVVQRRDGSFTAPFVIGLTNGGASMATGDLDGDRFIDVAGREPE